MLNGKGKERREKRVVRWKSHDEKKKKMYYA